jgi:hypothetical protein
MSMFTTVASLKTGQALGQDALIRKTTRNATIVASMDCDFATLSR